MSGPHGGRPADSAGATGWPPLAALAAQPPVVAADAAAGAGPSLAPGPEAPPALRLVGLARRFGLTPVLRGLDLSVPAGERLAVIGPNGAGKTTLFNLLSGRLPPSAGEVWLHGRRVDGLPPWQLARRGLARSFQVSQLFGGLTVRENLQAALLGALGPRHAFWRRLSRLGELRARAEALLVQLGLAHRAEVAAGTLSYAEQRALELGLAVAALPPPDSPVPRVLLLDEPTAGLGRHETEALVPLIRRLGAGCTVVLVEHDMGVVFDLADRIAVLVQGELLALDTPARVRADPRVQAAYLGALAAGGCGGADAPAGDHLPRPEHAYRPAGPDCAPGSGQPAANGDTPATRGAPDPC